MRRVSRLLVGLAASLAATGCVERRLTIRSDPPNALVVLDGQEIAFTPVYVPFHYYGVRQIKLVKDGYETLVVNQELSAPTYQWLGADFVSEALLPINIRDERDKTYTLHPKMVVPQDQFLQRGE